MRRHAGGTAVLVSAILAACTAGDGEGGGPETGVAITAADSLAAVQRYQGGELVIEHVVAPAPVPAAGPAAPVAVYFFVRNDGAAADTLLGVEITVGRASLHQQTGTGGAMETMVPLAFAVIPPGETTRFVPGGRHVMVEGLTAPVAVGDVIGMTLVFRRAGAVGVTARVVEYRDLEGVLSGDEHVGH